MMEPDPVFPVDMLLEEIMQKIFRMLSDEDVASCFRAYPKWRQWLMKERTRFLFPEVVPLFLKYLSKRSLLNCRKVCRSWKDETDNAYHQAKHYSKKVDYLTVSLTNRFDSTDMITNFLKDMEAHPGNPFPGKSLILEWNFPEDFNEDEEEEDIDLDHFHPLFVEFWNHSVIQLLNMFGHHVIFMCIDFEKMDWFEERLGLEQNNINIVQVMQRLLVRLPNLKQLEIRGVIFPEADDWAEAIRMTPLPRLINLETVMLVGPPYYVMQSVLQSCSDPTKIRQVDLYPIGSGFANVVYGFQNLEVMDVGPVTLEVLERFMTLERQPPLRKVVLGFLYTEYVDWRRFPDFQRLFTALNVFADTLKDVKLITTNSNVLVVETLVPLNNETKGFRINLPKLEKLSWIEYVGPLDPFIQLPLLRHLDFKFKKMLPWEGSAVQLYGSEERMETSNIWSLIPSLKTLTIKGVNNYADIFDKTYRRLIQGIICENTEEEETTMSENENDNISDNDVEADGIQ